MRSVALALLCSLAACAQPLPRHNYKAEPDPRRSDFILGPSDQLQITVWRNANLSTAATIRPDGTITMPLVGDLRAAGRTTRQLQVEIKDRLKDFVVGATVTVAVTEVNSYRFSVAGQVTHPGLFTARTYVTVDEALAMAGGPTRFADPYRTIIVRTDAKTGRTRRIPVNYVAIVSGDAPEHNLVILPGDAIYVP